MVLSRCLASLCEGAFVVFMTGLIGMLSLCIFGNAFSVGLICFRYNAFLGGYVLYIIYTFVDYFLIFCGRVIIYWGYAIVCEK